MSTQDSSHAALPPGFKTIAEIRSLSNEDLQAKLPVNVIGFVKDFMPPKQTGGTGEYSDTKINPTLNPSNMSCRLQMYDRIDGPFDSK